MNDCIYYSVFFIKDWPCRNLRPWFLILVLLVHYCGYVWCDRCNSSRFLKFARTAKGRKYFVALLGVAVKHITRLLIGSDRFHSWMQWALQWLRVLLTVYLRIFLSVVAENRIERFTVHHCMHVPLQQPCSFVSCSVRSTVRDTWFLIQSQVCCHTDVALLLLCGYQ
jgi:hypothetical protein